MYISKTLLPDGFGPYLYQSYFYISVSKFGNGNKYVKHLQNRVHTVYENGKNTFSYPSGNGKYRSHS